MRLVLSTIPQDITERHMEEAVVLQTKEIYLKKRQERNLERKKIGV